MHWPNPGRLPKFWRRLLPRRGGVIEAMLSSPHGMELLDTGSILAADIVAASQAQLGGLFTDWLNAQARAGRVRLTAPADELAGTITAALKGIKMTGADYATYKARVAHLAAMIGAGLATTAR